MKKKIISVLSTFLCIIGMSAQVPGSFQYQAVLRNDDGSIASNKPLEVRVRIHQGAADGTVVYEEAVSYTHLIYGSGRRTTE